MVKAILNPFSGSVEAANDDLNDFDHELCDIAEDEEEEEEEEEEGCEPSDTAITEGITEEVDLKIFISASQFAGVNSALLKVSHMHLSCHILLLYCGPSLRRGYNPICFFGTYI